MNSIIPPALAPYLKECIDKPSLTLLTSALDTPANWLVVRLLYLALNGQHGETSLAGQESIRPSERNVILVSVWRSFDLWNEIARKCGINLVEKISTKQLRYIDGLSTGSSSITTSKNEVIKLKSLTLKDLNNAISTALQSTTPTTTTRTQSASNSSTTKTTILIDGLDLLLACDPTATSSTTLSLLTAFHSTSHVHNIIVTCAADTPLLHNVDASATPLEHEHGELVRGLAWQAGWVVQLRPLETGSAREVNGSVRVSKGGAWEGQGDEAGEGEAELEEGEWLFHVKGDGGVRVWGRGEA